MAAYAQFGYGGGGYHPSATQLLSANAAQSPQGGDTPSVQSSIGGPAPPPLSPTTAVGDCHTNTPGGSGAGVGGGAGGGTGADTSTGALSPDGMSQHSNTAAGPLGGGGVGGTSMNPLGGVGGGTGSMDGSGSLGHVGGGGSCCENGRPIMTDPVSGQTVCSCQYDSARLALSSYSRLPAASVGVYGTPYPSTDQNPYQSIGVDSSAFYTPLSNPYALKDSATGSEMSAWTSAGLQPTTGYYSYDPMSAYGYGASYDLAARRKNATRESTATLKAWLNEHKKNPYPTKGEKIMLAIITKMTLTQVSTWFANARRRLKKENKMTWEPKNRTDDDDDAILSDEEKDKDDGPEPNEGKAGGGGAGPGGMHGGGGVGGAGMAAIMDHRKDVGKDEDDLGDEDLKPPHHANDMRAGGGLGFPGYQCGSGGVGGGPLGSGIGGGPLGGGGGGGAGLGLGTGSAMSSHPHAYHPYHHQHPSYSYQHQQAMLAASYQAGAGGGGGLPPAANMANSRTELSEPKNQLSRDCGVPIPASKPKIWSLADTVASKTPPPSSLPSAQSALATAAYMTGSHHHHHQQQQGAGGPQQQQQHMSGSHMAMQQQPPPPQQPPSHMIGSFGGMPYSRAPTTAYGAFLAASAAASPMASQHPMMNNMGYNNNINNSNSNINNNNNSITNNLSNNTAAPPPPHLTGAPTTPITLSSSGPHTAHQQQAAAGRMSSSSAAAVGFPEAQPDTPPQTPPNMKVPASMAMAATNLMPLMLTTASQAAAAAATAAASAAGPMIASCRTSSDAQPQALSYQGLGQHNHHNSGGNLHLHHHHTNNNNNNHNHSLINQYAAAARFGGYSPRDENSSSSAGSASSGCSSPDHAGLLANAHESTTNFKPLFKSNQMPMSGFVPPV